MNILNTPIETHGNIVLSIIYGLGITFVAGIIMYFLASSGDWLKKSKDDRDKREKDRQQDSTAKKDTPKKDDEWLKWLGGGE